MRIIFDIFVVVLCASYVRGNSPVSNSVGAVIKGDVEEKDNKQSSPIGTSGLNPPSSASAASSLSSFSLSAKASKVAEGVVKKETEKNLLKKLIQEDEGKRNNFGHSKSNKIKVASSKVTKDIDEDDDDEDEDEAGGEAQKNVVERNEQTTAITKQIVMGITYMAVSRFVMKLDFTNPKTLQLCRGIFAAYLLGSQLLFYFVKQRIEELNDKTLLDAEQPFSFKGLQEKIPMLSTLVRGEM